MKSASLDSGAAASRATDRSRGFALAIPIALMTAVIVVGATALLRWDVWFVNHDGTFYMALAHNLRHGAGYVRGHVDSGCAAGHRQGD